MHVYACMERREYIYIYIYLRVDLFSCVYLCAFGYGLTYREGKLFSIYHIVVSVLIDSSAV